MICIKGSQGYKVWAVSVGSHLQRCLQMIISHGRTTLRLKS